MEKLLASKSESLAAATANSYYTEVNSLLHSVLPDAKARIFGSRATGRNRPFSDLDLLIIQPESLTLQERADLRDKFEASELPFIVDIVEWKHLAEGMRERVVQESIALN